MTARILPPEEWAKLDGTDLGPVAQHFSREVTSVVVVEDRGDVVGCVAVYPVLTMRGIWIHPAYRKRTSACARLWAAIKSVGRERYKAVSVITASNDAEIEGLLKHVGGVRTGDEYAVVFNG